MSPLINRQKIINYKLLIITFYLLGAYFTYLSFAKDIIFNQIVISKILGTLSLSGLTLQLILSSRIAFIEKGIGLDRLSRWHRTNAKLLTITVILHPIIYFIEPLKRLNFEFLKYFSTAHYVGVLGLILLLVTVFLAVYMSSIKLSYERWKILHKLTYLVIILGFVHSFLIGNKIYTQTPIYLWWLFLLTSNILVTFYTLVYRKFKLRMLYEVVEIKDETNLVKTITLKPIQNRRIKNTSGQFSFVTFLSKELPQEEHPFTISSYYDFNSGLISHSIKALGDFTNKLNKLKVGDKALEEGPYGVFTYEGVKGPYVFIAGGIGITPFISMIKHMESTGNKDMVILLYANKKLSDVAFFNELNEIQKRNNWLRIIHILSDEDSPIYHKGFISKEILKSEIDYFNISKFFVCGPPIMMQSTKKYLKELGAVDENIYTEEFKLK